jgi:DNA-binding MarR family transcriptional regulator
MPEDLSVMTDFRFGRHERLPFPHVTGYWVNRLAAAFRTEVDRELRDHDLTRRQVAMLHFIARADRPTASDLTREMGVDSTAVTRMIDRLEDKGVVTRTQDPGDGRRNIVELTPAALRLMPKLGRTAQKVEALFEEGLGAGELATFHDVLMRMLENVNEAHFAMLPDE